MRFALICKPLVDMKCNAVYDVRPLLPMRSKMVIFSAQMNETLSHTSTETGAENAKFANQAQLKCSTARARAHSAQHTQTNTYRDMFIGIEIMNNKIMKKREQNPHTPHATHTHSALQCENDE